MTKSVKKKKNIRLRRQVRKTVGALFMASAITVAAIPVQDVSANPESAALPAPKVWVWDTAMSEDKPAAAISTVTQSEIPTVPENSIIYTSGDGRFQFAYVDPGTGVKVAVLLNYNSGVLQDSSLEIKNTMEAFRKYKVTSTEGYYCLVTQSDEFMFYDAKEQAVDEYERLLYTVPDIKYDETTHPVPVGDTKHKIGESIEVNYNELVSYNGQMVYREPVVNEEGESVDNYYSVDPVWVTTQKPCYYEDRDIWGSQDDTQLWYQVLNSITEDKPDGELHHPNSQAHYRIDASVQYIGKQFIDVVSDKDGNLTGWTIRTDEDGKSVFRTGINDGVFANNANITNLKIGDNMIGISDYAFQGCATLNSVSFGNGLATIGNGAFANCIRLNQCNIPENANKLQALGKDAFYNCVQLSSFKAPVILKAIGDSCFEGCTRLQSIDLGGGDAENAATTTSLQYIGNNAFKDCSALTSLFLPDQYKESDLQISVFEGCKSLQVVRVPNAAMDFKDTPPAAGSSYSYTFDDFKNDVPASFYFWGADSDPDMARTTIATLHKTANSNEIAYKYWDKNVYEIVVAEGDQAGDPRITYQVNDGNELQKIWLENNPKNVVIPKTIGPYGIDSIGTGCFDNACSIEKVTIPASVTKIAAGAFMGSHNLKTVIFDNATTITYIGPNAFRTQEVTCQHSGTVNANKTPSLTLVGAMMDAQNRDTVPFAYAMQRDNMINNAQQNESWITCHSGWPTNLEVKYNYDFTTGEGGSELQSYPRYSNFLNTLGNVDTDKIEAYVKSLPYVDEDDEEEVNRYVNTIREAIRIYNANDPLDPPTVEQSQIINSSKNIVVPTNVNGLKDGIFSGYTYEVDEDGNTVPKKIDGMEPDVYLNSVVLNGVDVVEPFTFTGCKMLQDVSAIGAEEIGDYAFGGIETLNTTNGKIEVSDSCEALSNVTLGPNITTTGLRPFRGCTKLSQISCLGDNLSYNNGLLFNNADGEKVLVECLPGRGRAVGSYTVEAGELAGVTGLQKEAFMDCNEIGKVDLSETTVEDIPERAFNNCDQLNSVVISDSTGSIEKDAFVNDPMLRVVTIPPSVTYIEKDAFVSEPEQQMIEVETTEKSAADRYANQNDSYMKAVYGKVSIRHTVYFWDYPDYPDTTRKELFYKTVVLDGEDAVPPSENPSHPPHVFTRWTDYTNVSRDLDVYPVFGSNIWTVVFKDTVTGEQVGDTQYIEDGRSATPPEPPEHEGKTFDCFLPDYHDITKDTTVLITYTDNSGDANRHTVVFYDHDGTTVISTQSVNHEAAAVEPKSPTRAGYIFTGWAPADFSNVVKDMNIVATYEKDTGNNSGGNNSGSGSSSASPSASASASPSASPEVRKYTVSVSGGSGGGSYAAGEIVALNAYYMGEGQVFDRWTSSTAGVGFANAGATSTTFTMPAANVAVTATYKTGSAAAGAANYSSTGGGGNSSSGRNVNNNGTTVQVTKPGISNTNLAGATVNGATDNFVIKVSEDSSAADAVLAALQAKYGDISRFKYLPMDISLYDATGQTKIADTSGISVNLTLPIPDELVQYAGNNKVAAVSGGVLEDLNTRFTTVGSVPCVNFTATHFSPYVIYVNTASLSQAAIDVTPKTGDPIHPKWFLALGMACISLILFFKRDKALINMKKA